MFEHANRQVVMFNLKHNLILLFSETDVKVTGNQVFLGKVPDSLIYLSAIFYYFLLDCLTIDNITYFCKGQCLSGKSLKVHITNITEQASSEKQTAGESKRTYPPDTDTKDTVEKAMGRKMSEGLGHNSSSPFPHCVHFHQHMSLGFSIRETYRNTCFIYLLHIVAECIN